uniref:Uncharacterized protein n=1 Tax=Zea mays TaxID=4577 RepID=B6UDH9_MAIZE|nr:hypothetical protein [Zea mays]
MEKRHGGGGCTLLHLLGTAAAMAFLLPRSAGAANDAKWHAHAHPVAGAGLSPLSAPPPTAGADDDLLPPPSRAPVEKAAPHFGFPLQPGDASAAAPSGSEGYPFIGSNPTVPLPTGMTDTSTVLPLPDTGTGDATTKAVGLAASFRAPVSSMIGLGVFLATLFLCATSNHIIHLY